MFPNRKMEIFRGWGRILSRVGAALLPAADAMAIWLTELLPLSTAGQAIIRQQTSHIGEAPTNICEGVTAVAADETRSFYSPMTIKGRKGEYEKFGTTEGWVVREFAQTLNNVTHSGQEPATGKAAAAWGISSLGAFYRNEGGKHVFYAPGETVKLSESYSFTVEPIMDGDELQANAMAATMRNMAANPAVAKVTTSTKQKPVPWAGLALILGIPLLLVGGLVYGIRRWVTHRRSLTPAPASAPFNPADIPVGARVADVVKADGTAMAVPPKPSDGAAWWRALPLSKRRAIIIVAASVLLLVTLFVTLRPAEPDETALLRKAVADAKTVTSPSALGMTPNEEPLPTVAQSGEGQPTPAEGHVGRFAVYRPANAKLLLDTFTTPAATDAALAAIHDHGPQEVLLLPTDSGAATSFAELIGARGRLALNFECRRTAAYLYCMTRPRRTAMLLTVRVPNDTDLTVDGVNDAKTVVAMEAQRPSIGSRLPASPASGEAERPAPATPGSGEQR